MPRSSKVVTACEGSVAFRTRAPPLAERAQSRCSVYCSPLDSKLVVHRVHSPPLPAAKADRLYVAAAVPLL
eukprot:5239409-Prymnesium_polylepis.2